jgi:hypothetical protein
MWIAVGLIVSSVLAVGAGLRSRAPAGEFDGEVYGMTPAAHRRYAAAGVVLAGLFALAFIVPGIPVIPMLAVAIATAIFYAASFVRGAEADE